MTIHNPYWDEVKSLAVPARHSWQGPQIGAEMSTSEVLAHIRDCRDDAEADTLVRRWAQQAADMIRIRLNFVRKYCWSVPSPDAVDFVIAAANDRILDPIAGTGYWAYLLTQGGVDCLAFDENPPAVERDDNEWHPNSATFTHVEQADAVDTVKAHGHDRTLFLSWPPNSPLAHDILTAYPGNRVIYLGENKHGCTGDSAFFELLDWEWTISEFFVLSQWDTIHDALWVFDRDGIHDGGEP